MIDPVLDQALIRQLCRVARDHGFRVERNDDGLPTLGGGICIYSERVIRISTRFSELEALPVLVHEVAHALLHSGKPWFDARESKGHDDEAKYVTSRVIRAVGLEHLLLEDVRSLPSEPPSTEADQAAQTILDNMPRRVVDYLAKLPKFGAPRPLYSPTADAAYAAVKQAALVLGFSLVAVSDTGGMRGMHVAGQGTLALADNLTVDEKACVLAHELSHGLQHPPGGAYSEPSEEERRRDERVAHAAAEIVVSQLSWPHYGEVAARAGFKDYLPALTLAPEELKEARSLATIISKALLLYPLPDVRGSKRSGDSSAGNP